ncbi:MAG: glycosyltransferase family 1 protein [Chloroflexi bacterium]|nr:MAG: glycosyltransferase family 1 protein [Chloroflexota bacterium]
MHVAINGWFWNRPETGSGQYTRQLVLHLAQIEPALRITVVIPGSAGPPLPQQPPNVVLLPGGRPRGNLGKVWFEQVTFPRLARRLGADLAHVPYWAPPLQPTLPTIVTIHDLIPLLLPEYRGGPLVRLYTALVRTATASAALVLTDSQASRRDIVTHLPVPPERVRAIPLAAGPAFRPQPGPDDEAIRRKYGLPEEYVLYLGGFDVRKNVVTLLQAWTFAEEAVGWLMPLVLAGRLPEAHTPFTPDPRRIRAALEIKPETVRFPGPIAEADKPAIYRGALCFLFPSRYEGFGLPPLEALACGVPVVGSNAASLPEVVGDAGILVDPDDARSMAGGLIALVHDARLHETLRRRALVQATHFSWEQTAQKTLDAYTNWT